MNSCIENNYLKGQIGESIAAKELLLNRLHIVNIKRLEGLVSAGKLGQIVLDLIHDYDHVIDFLKIFEDERSARIELYEIKTMTCDSRNFRTHRKPTVGMKQVQLFFDAQKLNIPMFIVIIGLYPDWHYTIDVQPMNINEVTYDHKVLRDLSRT